jgi:hypothetical protein
VSSCNDPYAKRFSLTLSTTPVVKRAAMGNTTCCMSLCISLGLYLNHLGSQKRSMLIHGTCNPHGEKNDYDGVYLTENDIDQIVSSGALVEAPVLLEHDSAPVGRVRSAWSVFDVCWMLGVSFRCLL